MLDCLTGLGHHAVIRGNHQDDNVRYLCTACTHSGKGRVTGCIKERDRATVGIHMIRTDMLCNATSLTRGNATATDII